jgi:hypothetical protein
MGIFRSVLDRNAVRYVSQATQTFSGTAHAGSTFGVNVNFPSDTVQSSVHISWGNIFSTNDLALKLVDANGNVRGTSNYLNLPGLTGKREQITMDAPPPGTLQAVVNHTGGIGTAQEFFGAAQATRAQYGALDDVQGLSPDKISAIKESLRFFVMLPENANRFRPTAAVSRAELAATLLRGGRVPQYLAATPLYSDVYDFTTRNFVESAQKSPNGKLFHDAANGGAFRPDESASKLVAAVALVKAANLQSLTQSTALPLTIADYAQIPSEWRGYVAVALQKGFLSLDEANTFAPNRALKRFELAQAMSKFNRLAID